LSPLAWVGIGCVALLLIGAIAMAVLFSAGAHFLKGKIDKFEKNPAYATMELAIQANPELEIVSSDEKAGTITVRNKKTGEEVTWNTEDFKKGKVSVKTKDGESNIDFSGGTDGGIKITNDKGESTFQMGGGEVKNLPSWVPSYPGATVQGTFDSTTNGARSLAYTVKSTDSVTKLMDFYESELKSAGLKVDKNTYSSNGTDGGSVSGKSDDGKRTLTAMISSDDGGAQALITVEDKN
jgi:hypothetical protein